MVKSKAAWRPKRFDVAGAHPDEAWRAVADVYGVVEEIRQGYEDAGYGRVFSADALKWQASKPLRFGNASDAQVQRFLAQGVELVDKLALMGGSPRQRQVRDRCNELAKSMEKVLAHRPDEPRRGQVRGRGRNM